MATVNTLERQVQIYSSAQVQGLYQREPLAGMKATQPKKTRQGIKSKALEHMFKLIHTGSNPFIHPVG